MRKIGFILAAIALSSSAVSAAPPVLGVLPTYMEFTAYEGGANPDPNILSIWRDGGNGPLNWTVTEDCNWLTVDPNSGKSTGEVDDCNVIVDIDGLVAGLYSCQLTVDAGTAANSPQIVDVNLFVMTWRTIFVDTNTPDNNDGSSWSKAYKYLQDALADANSSGDVNEIRVAQGIYMPDTDSANPNGSGDRDATFRLIDGVALKGGYAGYGEVDANTRDFEVYETILSGDLSDNDGDVSDPCALADDPNRAENSYTVVTVSNTDATAVLDGFTITGGYANYQSSWNPQRQYRGGGIYNDSGSPKVANCTFRANYAVFSGAAMENRKSCNPTLVNCMFSDNFGWIGGGISTMQGSSPTLTNCLFNGNIAGLGGAIHTNQGSITLTNCTFTRNSGYRFGGGMFIFAGTPQLTNCTFTGNSSPSGGGFCCFRNANVTVTNCIFWNNRATDGNEIAVREDAMVYSTATVSYCDVKGGQADVHVDAGCTLNWGPGNLNADPCFADPCGGDYHLLLTSSCIDTGDPCYIAEPNETDFDGRDRVVDGDCNTTDIVDMGAYEFNWVYIGDFAGQCDVDLIDFSILALTWLLEDGQPGYDPNCDISLPVDGIIDERDLDIFTDNWLAGL